LHRSLATATKISIFFFEGKSEYWSSLWTKTTTTTTTRQQKGYARVSFSLSFFFIRSLTTAAAANGSSNSNKYIANKKEETGIKPANNIKNDCAYQQSEREREREREISPPCSTPFSLSFSLSLSLSAFLPRFLDSFTINSDTSTFCHPVALARVSSFTRCPCPFVPLLSRTI